MARACCLIETDVNTIVLCRTAAREGWSFESVEEEEVLRAPDSLSVIRAHLRKKDFL